MGDILRPRFGQPCFSCENPVPEPRVSHLRERAERERRTFLKNDILCIDCERGAPGRSKPRGPARPGRM